MGKEFNKTEADFTYERYDLMSDYSPEQDIPDGDLAMTSALASHKRAGAIPVDFDGVVDNGSDPELAGDEYLAADIGLNVPPFETSSRTDRDARRIVSSPAPDRDELLESDASFAADAAGLTGASVELGASPEADADLEEHPLEDIPDADEVMAGTPVDPAAPSIDAMPGIDVLNGSNGEDD